MYDCTTRNFSTQNEYTAFTVAQFFNQETKNKTPTYYYHFTDEELRHSETDLPNSHRKLTDLRYVHTTSAELLGLLLSSMCHSPALALYMPNPEMRQ